MILSRKMRDKENLLNMSSNITDQLLSISRLLADSTQRSADTLSTLGMTTEYEILAPAVL